MSVEDVLLRARIHGIALTAEMRVAVKSVKNASQIRVRPTHQDSTTPNSNDIYRQIYLWLYAYQCQQTEASVGVHILREHYNFLNPGLYYANIHALRV